MTVLSEKDVFKKLARKDLEALLKLFAQMMLTVDGLWFVSTEQSTGREKAIRMDEGVWQIFGAMEARRLKKFLGKAKISTLEEVCEIVLISPMWISVGPRAEIIDDRCFLTVTDCQPQKARLRHGLDELPCKSMGMAYFEGFAVSLDPGLKYRCISCPPDEHTDNEWCRWEVGWTLK